MSDEPLHPHHGSVVDKEWAAIYGDRMLMKAETKGRLREEMRMTRVPNGVEIVAPETPQEHDSMSDSQKPGVAYVRKVPRNNNPNAMPMDFPPDYNRAGHIQFAIACNHDDGDVLPDKIPEKPIHIPVVLDGVVP